MTAFFEPTEMAWKGLQEIDNRRFTCGYCSRHVSSDRGFKLARYSDASGEQKGGIHICPNCRGPVFLSPKGFQYPTAAAGRVVKNLPDDVGVLYEEARRCTGENCHTACVLACRKILMHVAVSRGAAEGLRFIEYVNYLSDQGYTPPDGKGWVDQIRRRGNEANHEIRLMSETDAQDLLIFTEMLLRFIYEFPAMIKADEAEGSGA